MAAVRFSVSTLGLWSILPLHQTVFARVNYKASSQQPLDVATPPTSDEKAHYYAQGGNDVVHEIWSVLRDFEPTWIDSVANHPPSSMTGQVWYYSKIVLRALFMNSPTRGDDSKPKVRGDLKNALETLEIGAKYEDPDAIYLLAQMNFFGNFSNPRDFKQAFKWYDKLARLNGNSSAQHMLGLMYATGIGDAVERDQAKALIYHTFAAEQGNTQSEMTLAFRYRSGIGCSIDCAQASRYYKRVADKAMDWWQSGPPGGQMIQRNSVRWIEYEGGSYGEGASMSSSGPHAYKEGSISASFDDVLEILDVREKSGDWHAVLTLAKYYYEPPRGYRRNFRKAQLKFQKIARAYWNHDGTVKPKAPKGIEKDAGEAATYIGRMHLRGEAVGQRGEILEQDFKKAMTWLRRGISLGDSFAQYHLGVMHRDGLGMPADGFRAATYFHAAAEQGLPIAQSALGALFLDQGEVDTAIRYFELAARAGIMEAQYYLAEVINKGVGQEANCDLSVIYYKLVAEKAEILHSSFVEANAAYDRGDLDRAFIVSLMAAEQGYEHAQANVALLLDQKTSLIQLPSVPLLSNPLSPVSYYGIKRSKLLDDPALALVYFVRSAKQLNIDSMIKTGDYYLSGVKPIYAASVSATKSGGLGDADNSKLLEPDADKASTVYATAAETHHSAHALWNLGWMHENGIGPITQDFHMAKRYYDLALITNKEAYLPVKLALFKLRLRSWWNGISGGTVNSIRSDDEADSSSKSKRPQTFMEWINRFLDAAEEMEAQEYADAQRAADGDIAVNGEPGMPGGDNDYYYGGNNRGGQNGAGANNDGVEGEYLDVGEFDDGIIESLVIIALAGALALLVYARQQHQRQRERDERQRQGRDQDAAQNQNQNQNNAEGPPQPQPQAQPDGGFFPAANEPDFNNWVAGGIGH